MTLIKQWVTSMTETENDRKKQLTYTGKTASLAECYNTETAECISVKSSIKRSTLKGY